MVPPLKVHADLSYPWPEFVRTDGAGLGTLTVGLAPRLQGLREGRGDRTRATRAFLELLCIVGLKGLVLG